MKTPIKYLETKYLFCKNLEKYINKWEWKCYRDLSEYFIKNKDKNISWKQYYYKIYWNMLKPLDIFFDGKYIGTLMLSPNDRIFDILSSSIKYITNLNPRYIYGSFSCRFKINQKISYEISQLTNEYYKNIQNIFDKMKESLIIIGSFGNDINYEFGNLVIEKHNFSSQNKFVHIESAGFSNNGCCLSIQGNRKTMEDSHIYEKYCRSNCIVEMYGVFDGHGGTETSYILKNKFPQYIIKNLENVDIKNISYVKQLLCNIFIDFDQWLFSKKDELDKSGSTAIICLVIQHINGDLSREYNIYLINLGDSRGIIAVHQNNNFQILLESLDHKPSSENEIRRIISCGGYIKNLNIPRVNGYLSVSRSFGDFRKPGLKTQNLNYLGIQSPLSPEPDIFFSSFHSSSQKFDIYLLLACDGLWDVIKSSEAFDIIKKIGYSSLSSTNNSSLQNNYPLICSSLITQAFKRGSNDNISVMYSKLFSPNLSVVENQQIQSQKIYLFQNHQNYSFHSFADSFPRNNLLHSKYFDFVQNITDILNTSDINIYQVCNKKPISYILEYRRNKITKLDFKLHSIAARNEISPIPFCSIEIISKHNFKYGILLENMETSLLNYLLNNSLSDYEIQNILTQISNIFWKLIDLNICHNYFRIHNFYCQIYNNNLKIFVSNFSYSYYFSHSLQKHEKHSLFIKHINMFTRSLFDILFL